MSSLLPAPDEAAWLLEELAALIATRGAEPFVAGALLEPTAAHFPERWSPDAAGVRRLAKHLLAQVGLGALRVHVDIFQGEREVKEVDTHGRPAGWSHDGAAAWYAGTERGVCHFGAEAGQLDQPTVLAGVMAHEVAHAYRDHHRLEVGDRGLEELLTDITTIYLGFGVLTTNASYRFETRSSEDGMLASTTEWQRTGYLSVGDMAYLLAAHTLVRRDADAVRARIVEHLGVTQRALFKDACKAIARDEPALATELRLPPAASWPPLRALVVPAASAAGRFGRGGAPPAGMTAQADRAGRADRAAARRAAAEAAAGLTAAEVAARRARNAGEPVFRLARDHAPAWAVAGIVVGGLAGLVLTDVAGSGMTLSFALAAAGAITGWGMGRRGRHDVCADPSCTWIIAPAASVCPGCGGTVSGRVAHQDQRLAAAERVAGDDQSPPA